MAWAKAPAGRLPDVYKRQPLGLYTPLVDGIGSLDLGVLVPAGIGAVVTILCLAKAIDALFTRFYSCAFHAIIGIVIAATLVIIPFESFTASVGGAVANVCLLYTSGPTPGPAPFGTAWRR